MKVADFEGIVGGNAGGEFFELDNLVTEAFGEPRPQDGMYKTFAAAAYLNRRFGPSPNGFDDYKDLGAWILGTPKPGLFLHVYPKCTTVGFGYLATAGVSGRLNDEAYGEWFGWNRKFVAWLKRNGLPPHDGFAPFKASEMRAARPEIGPRPKSPFAAQHWMRHDWRSRPPYARAANLAVLRAIVELTRPVGIRDVCFDVLGRTRGESETKLAPTWIGTGYGFPRKAIREMEKRGIKDQQRRL